MAKVEYVRCPRCELNYIDKRDKLCKVCQMELQAHGSDDDEELEPGICPVCKTNYIGEDEEMCALCFKEKQMQESQMKQDEDSEDWYNMDSDDENIDSDTTASLDDDMIDEDLDMGLDDEDL
mgnify:FL=1